MKFFGKSKAYLLEHSLDINARALIVCVKVCKVKYAVKSMLHADYFFFSS